LRHETSDYHGKFLELNNVEKKYFGRYMK